MNQHEHAGSVGTCLGSRGLMTLGLGAAQRRDVLVGCHEIEFVVLSATLAVGLSMNDDAGCPKGWWGCTWWEDRTDRPPGTLNDGVWWADGFDVGEGGITRFELRILGIHEVNLARVHDEAAGAVAGSGADAGRPRARGSVGGLGVAWIVRDGIGRHGTGSANGGSNSVDALDRRFGGGDSTSWKKLNTIVEASYGVSAILSAILKGVETRHLGRSEQVR